MASLKHLMLTILTTALVACGGIVDAPAPAAQDAPDAAPACATAPGPNACPRCACIVGAWHGQQWCAPDGAPLGPCIADDMPPAERFARAVCACEGNPPGCLANAIGESWRANAACLNAMAAGYERDCTGRSGPNGCGL